MTTTNKTKRFTVYAFYFESGNTYPIYSSDHYEQAALIANKAEANLTNAEANAFQYIVTEKAFI